MQGKLDAFKKAEDAGVKGRKMWVATLDTNTRDTHQSMDGEYANEEGLFSITGVMVEAPGMTGDPAEDINCRCTYIYEIEGFEPKHRRERLSDSEYERRLEEAGGDKSKVSRSEVKPYRSYDEYAKARGWDQKYTG